MSRQNFPLKDDSERKVDWLYFLSKFFSSITFDSVSQIKKYLIWTHFH